MAESREYPGRPLVGIGVILLRPAGAAWQVLLIRRGRAPALGSWSLPGGAQRLGETAEAAARRELMEETGLSVGALTFAAHVDSIHHDGAGRVQYHYTILDFVGVYEGGDAMAGGDAAGICWAGEDDFEGLSLWQEARRVVLAGVEIVKKERVLF
jgi:8-oxo-dGTP diphosphatase